MPKAFTDCEKDAIRRDLATVALQHFQRHGIRAARIDDICREVGIAKGSFYAFYSSKEELFMVIADAREALHRRDMLAYVEGADPAGVAAGFFELVLDKIETDPVLNIVLAGGELAHLMRRLGPERLAANQEGDRAFAFEAAQRWPRPSGAAPLDPDDLMGLMTLTLTLATQRRLMAPQLYAATVGLLRELYVSRLEGGRK